MDYLSIIKDVEKIERQVEAIESIPLQEESVKMTVGEFNAILDSVKKYDIFENKDSAYFAQVFDNDEYYSNISIYLDQIIRRISIKTEQKGVSLQVSKNMQISAHNIRSIMQLLTFEYGNLLKIDSKKWIQKYSKDRDFIRSILINLNKLDKKINQILSAQAQIIANVVLGEFKILYKFFLYSIKTAKMRQDELLLVEIAGMTDRIISMIMPVFSEKSLKTEEMIYHYLTYELKELKVDSIGGNLS
ncbi:MAG: imidazole glycerol phosphate synthase [Campylobacter sp.]